MTIVPLELPELTFSSLGRAPHEVALEIRVAAAIHWYQQGTISMEHAADVAGMTRLDFLAELAARHVDVFQIDMDDLRTELADG